MIKFNTKLDHLALKIFQILWMHSNLFIFHQRVYIFKNLKAINIKCNGAFVYYYYDYFLIMISNFKILDITIIILKIFTNMYNKLLK